MKPYLGIWGVERSGTNWLETLLKNNFIDCYITSHEKHSPRDDFSIDKKHRFYHDESKFIAIIKNPYAWFYSNCIKYKMATKPRFNKDKKKIKDKKEKLLRYYNLNNESYIKMSKKHPKKVILIKYEDLLNNTEKKLREIAKIFKVKTLEDIHIEKNIIAPGRVIKDQEFRTNLYTENLYLKYIRSNDLQFIRDHRSQIVMDTLNYKDL